MTGVQTCALPICDFMGKKNPFVFTIGFDKSDPDHVYVTELLNTTEKKAKLIVAAILAYTGRTDETGNGSISMEPDMLRPMMQQIIREEVRKVLEGQLRTFCAHLRNGDDFFEMEFVSEQEDKGIWRVKGARIPKKRDMVAGIITPDRKSVV